MLMLRWKRRASKKCHIWGGGLRSLHTGQKERCAVRADLQDVICIDFYLGTTSLKIKQVLELHGHQCYNAATSGATAINALLKLLFDSQLYHLNQERHLLR